MGIEIEVERFRSFVDNTSPADNKLKDGFQNHQKSYFHIEGPSCHWRLQPSSTRWQHSIHLRTTWFGPDDAEPGERGRGGADQDGTNEYGLYSGGGRMYLQKCGENNCVVGRHQ